MTMSSFFILFWCCDVNVRFGHGVISESFSQVLLALSTSILLAWWSMTILSVSFLLPLRWFYLIFLFWVHVAFFPQLWVNDFPKFMNHVRRLCFWTFCPGQILIGLVLGQTWVGLVTKYWNCKQEATLCLIVCLCGTSAFSTLTILPSFFYSTPATIRSGSEFVEHFLL